jgi:hypothetical protein
VKYGDLSAASAVACTVAWGIWGDPAVAQQSPRACIEAKDEAPPGGLAIGQLGVIAREAQFAVGQKQYVMQTFADTAPSGRTRSEQCFRYEVENTGSEIIRQFYWPLAGINVDPVNPGRPRPSKIRALPILEAPIDIVSSLFAFEDEKAVTRAWAERQYKETGNQTQSSESPRMALTKPDAFLPGLSALLEKAKLPTEPFFTVYLNEGEISREAPTLHDRYSSLGLNIDVSSNAVRVGKSIIIQTTINIAGQSTGGLQYSMPALRAWDKFGTLTNLNAYSQFISVLVTSKRNLKSFNPSGSLRSLCR